MRIRSIAAFVAASLWLASAGRSFANDEAPLTGIWIERPTAEGRVRGYRHNGTWHFRGIPYARPPVGELRWRSPQAPLSRAAVFDAKAWGPDCPQEVGQGSPLATVTQAEDCLHLNIWTRSFTGAKPVMVWIHGGAFAIGSPVSPYTMGDTLAREHDVVVVTINYRLGALGFLVLPDLVGEDPARPETAGNYGVLDQIRALEWVRDNIAHFGGDPGNVTVFGESAGGVSVLGLLASPLSEGLFHKAIVQSGPALGDLDMYDLPAASLVGDAFKARVGCPDLACLRGKSPEAIVAQGPGALAFMQAARRAMPPVRDGNVFPDSIMDTFRAGRPKPAVPLLIGSNSLEGTMFQVGLSMQGVSDWASWAHERFGSVAGEAVGDLYLRRQYPIAAQAAGELLADAFFNCPTRRIVELASADGARIYAYWFDYPTNLLPGALHASEIPFVFGTVNGFPDAREERASRSMANYWTSFARNGDPNGAEEDQWHPWPSSYLEVKRRWDAPVQARPAAEYMSWTDAGDWRDDSPAPLQVKSALCEAWDSRIEPLYWQP